VIAIFVYDHYLRPIN